MPTGDAASARRMLGLLAVDGSTPPSMAADAGTTLVEVLIGEGKLDRRQQERLDRRRAQRGDDNAAAPRVQALRVGSQQGASGARTQLMAGDSTVDGLALCGAVQSLPG